MSDLRDLYQEVILDHSRNPRNFHALDAATHQADGFMTIAISDGDPADAVEAFIMQYKLPFVVLVDPDHIAATQAFKTRSLPSSFVIDRECNIRLRWVGEIDRDTLEEYVTPLILE